MPAQHSKPQYTRGSGHAKSVTSTQNRCSEGTQARRELAYSTLPRAAYGLRSKALVCASLLSLLTTTLILAPAASAQQQSQSANEAEKNARTARGRLSDLEGKISTHSSAEEQERARAEAAAKEVARLQQDLVQIAHNLQVNEREAATLEGQIASLEADVAARSDALEKRNDELATLLGALASLSRRPASTALLQPGEAVNTARSAAVMGRLVPEINALADQLAKDVESLSKLKTELVSRSQSLQATISRISSDQKQVAALQAAKKREEATARSNAAAEQAALKKLASEAGDLRDLIDKLEDYAAKQRLAEEREAARLAAEAAERAEREARDAEAARAASRARSQELSPFSSQRSFTKAKGTLGLPAYGQIITNFGEKAGPATSRGITIEARAGAQITAPFDGQVVYAGPYRAYGQILIISHGEGYHTLLAGLSNLSAEVGQWLLSGEPVGSVSNRPLLPGITGGPDTQSKAGRGELYLEIREGGHAVNPVPWLSKRALADATRPNGADSAESE